MDENTNPPPTKKDVNDVYPVVYKGYLKDDPLVDIKRKPPIWKFWRGSDDSFNSLYLLIAGVFLFAIICVAVVLKAF